MKKQIGLFIAILFAVSTLMVGCKAEVHTHTFAEEWSSDETDHWHDCKDASCTEVNGKVAHSGGTATCVSKAKCEVCNEEYGSLKPIFRQTLP